MPPRGPRRASRRLPLVAGCAVSITVLTSACADTPDQQPPPMTTSSTPAPEVLTVSVETSDYGEILVDDEGQALYLSARDPSHRSTCYNTCAEIWLPFTTNGKPEASGDAHASQLAVISRTDGTDQVTYGGHPLYYFADDNPDTTNGHNLTQFATEWYLVSPAGNPVTRTRQPTETDTGP